MKRTIKLEHLTRVEGHGGVTVVLDGTEVHQIQLDIFEGIRLFEGLVIGRSLEEIPAIVSRICAICSHGHALTSIRALEAALGLQVSGQTATLRDLAFQGQNIESHALHVFVLALPDILGHPSVLSLAAANRDAVALALRLKKLGNTIQEVVGGRAVHPVNYVVGGFGRVPSVDDLAALRRDLQASLQDCERALDLLATLRMPDFMHEPMRFAALVPAGDAFFFGDTIAVSTGARIPVTEYRRLTNERDVAHSHARHSAYDGRSYMVGALARLTLHGERLGGLARRAWTSLGLELPSDNILHNTVAQAIEMIYSVEHALELVELLLKVGIRPEAPVPFAVHACQGAAASEVPRGTLYCAYSLDADGRVTAADVITPTAQNLSNAEDQLRAAVRYGSSAGDDELVHRLELVTRAYDPCISCSVHVVRRGTDR